MSLPKQLSTKAAVQKLIWKMAAYNSTIDFPLELSETLVHHRKEKLVFSRC